MFGTLTLYAIFMETVGMVDSFLIGPLGEIFLAGKFFMD
jgi:hypothetical protein